ncbi:MAG: hypothetical protein ACRDXB_13520 [Actinomycetes bacterium]
MRRILFKGVEGVERTAWVQHGFTVQRALEARGYSVTSEDGYNPWAENDTLVSAAGTTEKGGSAYHLFMTADKETLDLVWSAIEMSHPDASCKWEALDRPA